MSLSIVVKVKKISEKIGASIPLPSYSTPGSAGVDLPACIDEPLVVAPGQRASIPTGMAIEVPDRHIVGLIFPRSGLASRHGITLANAVGVVDSDYKGEILVAVHNQGSQSYAISPGERIAQLVFMPVFEAIFEEAAELAETGRGAGGFGSTGKI
ncbi:MAG: Deoxyuridine 5'-triphosphate nucleotidohydrolase [Pelotomaculum sp. PtaB.Bin104]|nr:MAG: Deoxyuridine 5'-triphosphate nucleotidohydrolase [Pelotomaculum sp. PtaB.Bin104]